MACAKVLAPSGRGSALLRDARAPQLPRAAAPCPRPLAGARGAQRVLHVQHGTSCRARRLAVSALLTGTSSNPMLTYGGNASVGYGYGRDSQEMTVQGTLNRAALLLAMSMATAAATWMQIFSGNAAAVMASLGAAKACGVVGILAVLASMFKPQWAPVTAPVYALCKGVAMAGMSAVLEMAYPGIALNAVLLTFSTAASLLFLLKAQLIRVTDRFADTVRAVTSGYFVAMLLIFVGSLVGLRLPGLFSGGPIAVAVSLVAAGLAAANLLLDMSWIERASQRGLPSWMNWYAAQSLMVTLVWLYTEVLRLLWMLAGGRSDD